MATLDTRKHTEVSWGVVFIWKTLKGTSDVYLVDIEYHDRKSAWHWPRKLIRKSCELGLLHEST